MEAHSRRLMVQFHHEAAQYQHADRSILIARQRAGLDHQFLASQSEAAEGESHAGAQIGGEAAFHRAGAASVEGRLNANGGGLGGVDEDQGTAAAGIEFAPQRRRVFDARRDQQLVEIVSPRGKGKGLGRRAQKWRCGTKRGQQSAARERHRSTGSGWAGSAAGCEMLLSWPQAA